MDCVSRKSRNRKRSVDGVKVCDDGRCVVCDVHGGLSTGLGGGDAVGVFGRVDGDVDVAWVLGEMVPATEMVEGQ